MAFTGQTAPNLSLVSLVKGVILRIHVTHTQFHIDFKHMGLVQQ